jgi:S-DNA-T family DNA segregation ATPase FtsK/SpoIIIE
MSKQQTKSKSIPTPMAKQKRQRLVLFGAFLILISVLLFIAMISYFNHWQEDFSSLENFKNPSVESANVLKKIGAYISHFLVYQLFGLGAFILAYLILNTGVTYFLNWKKIKLLKQWSWGLLNVLWLSISMGFFYELNPILSGVVGYEVFLWLKAYMGSLGLISLLLFALLCFLVIELDWTPERIKGWFFSNASSSVTERQGKPTEVTLNQEDEHLLNELKGEDISLNTTSKIEPSAPPPSEAMDTDQVSMEVETPEEEAQAIAKDLIEKQGHFDPTLVLSKYQFPSLNLLKDYGNGSITINQEELELNKNKIVDTLNNYKIGIAHIKATIGPTVTLYEIVPDAGIRISKIKNLEDDIALSLSALGIRIIAPIPGKGTIGIEVPNQKPSIVSMRSVLSANKFQKAEMELPLALGKTISNETFVVDLTKMPHLLMAGATGQGKSVGLNAVISSLLYKKHPAEVKFVLVDPKKVELNIYNKIERHYLAKLPDSEDAIITDNSKVINTLNSLCIEMDNRYELLKNALCRNVKEYNKKFEARKLNPNEGHNFLPYIVLIIDEFADLIMTAGKEVETPIARLAQLARAVGIHLIIATQRPSVNVITGIIKANFPARIAFRVTSKIDSRTILDNGGAEQLIGRGDMLYTQGNDLTRLQCAFVDTPEVERIAAFIGAQTGFAEAHLLPEYVGEENESILDIDASERDSLFKEAAEVIVVAQQGSASLLQRKLKLGYNRAGRIIDQMEAAGIVGPFEGSKARQVLIPDLSSLERFLNNES